VGKVKLNSDFKNYKVTLVEDDVMSTYSVLDIHGNDIEYEYGMLPISEGVKYYDLTGGGVHFLFNVDIPVKVEADNLRLLRRSQAIKNLFTYDRHAKFDIFKFLPWLVIILLVFFK
jgi:hypothetical protein